MAIPGSENNFTYGLGPVYGDIGTIDVCGRFVLQILEARVARFLDNMRDHCRLDQTTAHT